jgi:hypothetical protein
VQPLARHANVATTQQYVHLARAPRHVEAMLTVENDTLAAALGRYWDGRLNGS